MANSTGSLFSSFYADLIGAPAGTTFNTAGYNTLFFSGGVNLNPPLPNSTNQTFSGPPGLAAGDSTQLYVGLHRLDRGDEHLRDLAFAGPGGRGPRAVIAGIVRDRRHLGHRLPGLAPPSPVALKRPSPDGPYSAAKRSVVEALPHLTAPTSGGPRPASSALGFHREPTPTQIRFPFEDDLAEPVNRPDQPVSLENLSPAR